MKNSVNRWLMRPTFLLSIALAGCVSDPNYDIDKMSSIDGNMTLFADGLEIPIGKTEEITVGKLIDLADGEDGKIKSFLTKDASGNYSIFKDGNYNLDKVISDLHLEKLKDIDGTSFSKEVEYKIGDFDPSQFEIEGKEFSYSGGSFGDISLEGINVPQISSKQTINAELYKYLPDDMDLGKRIGGFQHDENILNVSDISIPGSGDTEISIQNIIASLEKTEIPFQFRHDVNHSINLGENGANIADVRNFKINGGSKLQVELEIVNCPLTGGEIVPDLGMDVSSMMSVSVSNPIDLSGLVLTKANSWKTSRTFSITSLADGFPEFKDGKLLMEGAFKIDGKILVRNALSTPNTVNSLAGKTMMLKTKISLDGVVLDEMDITLADGVGTSVPDIKMPFNISFDLPSKVKSVNRIYFSPDKKMSVTIVSTDFRNIKTSDGAKHLSIVPDVEISFPQGIEIAEAVGGKVTIKGEDLYNGTIEKQYTLVSLTPETVGGKLQFNGDIVVKASAGVSGTFNSKYLPSTEANDIVVNAQVSANPSLSDYDITLDKDGISQKIDEKGDFSFEMNGMADFGTFKVYPKENPKAVLEFNLPATSEIELVAENLVVGIPGMMVIDGSLISGFDEAKNTITINGKFPSKIELPIKHLVVTPQSSSDGKTTVSGTFTINGGVSVSKTDITKVTLDEIKGKEIGVKISVPSIKLNSIEMEGDFSKSLDYDGKDIVILDSKAMANIPKEVKSIDEITFEGVNAILEISITGLPDMKGSPFILKDTRIQLPPFLFGENDSNLLAFDDGIEVSGGKTIVCKAPLTKIKGLDIAGKDQIAGDIKLMTSLYSQKPMVDLSKLKSTIKASVKIGVGNGTGADAPGKINISKGLLKVNYNLEQQQTINFGEIPEELKGEGINLALNPEMHLELKTNFGAPINGRFTLTPYIAGKPGDAVVIDKIEMPCAEDWKLTETLKYAIGSKVVAGEGETLIATDLSPLLKRVPDSIRIEIKAVIDDAKTCTIFPAAKYSCDMNYRFNVPVSFGENFNIDLKSDIDIDASANDYIKMADELLLTGAYSTSLPIKPQLTATLLDKDDRVIELKEPAAVELDCSGDGRTKTDGKFNLRIAFKNPGKAELKTIRLNINIKASPNVNLNEEQGIQFSDIKVTIPKGIKVNVSE